jgi:glycosyltransferase involved in cell wall biosynthesis
VKRLSKIDSFPSVTIITVILNLLDAGRTDDFIKMVESVNSQDYPGHVEHIIMDGNSTDGTLNFLERFAGKLKIYSKKDNGIYDAMNDALSKTTSECVCFLNSDDYFCRNDAIKLSIEQMARDNSSWSFANAKIIDERTGRVVKNWISDANELIFGVFPCHQTVFCRTDILRKIGGFNLDYHISADNDMMTKLFKEFKYSRLDATIVSFKAGGFSKGKESLVKDEFAKSFYMNFANRLGISQDTCTTLWGKQCFSTLTLKENIRIFTSLSQPNFRVCFVTYYIKYLLIYLKNYIKCVTGTLLHYGLMCVCVILKKVILLLKKK